MVRTRECLHARTVPVHLRAHHTVRLYSVPPMDSTVKSGTENVLRKIAAIRTKWVFWLLFFGLKSGIQLGCFCSWVGFFWGGGRLPKKFVLWGSVWKIVELNHFRYLSFPPTFVMYIFGRTDKISCCGMSMDVCGSLSWAGFAEVHNMTCASCVVALWMVVKFCQWTEVHIATCTVFCRVLVDGCEVVCREGLA